MATGVPYLGSKISLISKSEIRYEGILYTIDTKESTVALAKVRSYGTEDRPTDRPVAPRDETYEYIIFRGSDIKDIRVCQPPKPRPTLEGGLPNDPAIVQHSRGPEGLPGRAPGSGAGDSGAPGAAAPSGGKPGYGPIGTGNASSSAPGGQPPFSAAPGSGAPHPAGGANQANGSPVLDMLKDGQSGTSSPAVGAPGQTGHGRPSSRTSGGDARRGRGGYRGGNRGGVGAGGQQRGGGQVQAGSYRGGSNGSTNHRGGRGGFQPGRPSQSKKDTLKFDSEYDFETANEEFKEIISKFEKVSVEDGEKVVVESGEEIEEGEITAEDSKTPSVDADSSGGLAPPCYDKAKSFFDNISCEAVERSKGQRSNRPDWKAEKKLNRETFGTTGFNRRNYSQGYHRGGGRGGGGYNNQRGGGYGYNNQRGGGYGYHNNQQGGGGGGGYNHHNNRYNRGGGGRGWNSNGRGGRGGGRGQRGDSRPWGEVRAEQ